jgi:predicted amidophosphoribosyltransferase
MKNNSIKSLFCYGNTDIKKIIWSLKTKKDFYKSPESLDLMRILHKQIDLGTANKDHQINTILLCAPSSSFWQNKKSYDHMHVFIRYFTKQVTKFNKLVDFEGNKLKTTNKINYIPHAIIPSLHKDSQKNLNKEERQKQTKNAYKLSNYFKYYLKQIIRRVNQNTFNDEIEITNTSTSTNNKLSYRLLIIDDVKTTGSTLIECENTIRAYLEDIPLLDPQCFSIDCLTIAYEA